MNNKKIIALILVTVAANVAAEQRTSLKFESLPDKVQATVEHTLDRNLISSIENIVTDDGVVKFEIKTNKDINGKNYTITDMVVAPDGEIMRVAREAPFFKIPFPLMKKLGRNYPGLKTDEVEVVQTRYFLLTGKIDGQPVKLKLYEDGKIEEAGKPANPEPAAIQPMPEPASQQQPVDSDLPPGIGGNN